MHDEFIFMCVNGNFLAALAEHGEVTVLKQSSVKSIPGEASQEG
jgi:hypothetical protein